VGLDQAPVDDVAARLAEQRVNVLVPGGAGRREEQQVLPVADPGHQVDSQKVRDREDRAADPFALVLEGGEETGEVLAQVGADFIAGLGAVPDRILLGAGEHGDRLGELAVVRQRPVCGLVRAQDVREHQGIAWVGYAHTSSSAGSPCC
jgi:hypothetical protein